MAFKQNYTVSLSNLVLLARLVHSIRIFHDSTLKVLGNKIEMFDTAGLIASEDECSALCACSTFAFGTNLIKFNENCLKGL